MNRGFVNAAWNHKDELARMTLWPWNVRCPCGPYRMMMSESCLLLNHLWLSQWWNRLGEISVTYCREPSCRLGGSKRCAGLLG